VKGLRVKGVKVERPMPRLKKKRTQRLLVKRRLEQVVKPATRILTI